MLMILNSSLHTSSSTSAASRLRKQSIEVRRCFKCLHLCARVFVALSTAARACLAVSRRATRHESCAFRIMRFQIGRWTTTAQCTIWAAGGAHGAPMGGTHGWWVQSTHRDGRAPAPMPMGARAKGDLWAPGPEIPQILGSEGCGEARHGTGSVCRSVRER